MNHPLYFISDLHFHLENSPADREKLRLLTGFFDEIKRKRGILFIVGDLFDFWFEYKFVIPKDYFQVLTLLKSLTEAGIEVHYFAGNHDYWIDDFFRNELAIRFHPDPIAYTASGKSFWICHGDGVLQEDRGYRILKSILRSPVAISLFRWIHPDLGFTIAKHVSSTSRRLNPSEFQKNRRLLGKVYQEYVIDRFREEYHYVIMGHIHQPHIHTRDGHTFISLGDWMRHYSFGYFDGERMTLNYWRNS